MYIRKAILEKEIIGHPTVGHVSLDRIFSEEEEKILTNFIYFIILQSITA
jgi:hypothetical protein